MIMLETLTEREQELRVNRTIYWLRRGLSPEQLDADRIGASPADMPNLVANATARMKASDEANAVIARKNALFCIIVGLVFLCFAFFLSRGDVPIFRQGRLLLAFGFGGASLAWGLFRLFNRNPDYHF